MRIFHAAFFAAFLLVFSKPALSLTPPLKPEELLAQSDLVVEGKVLAPVQCLEVIEKNDCADKEKYSATLEVRQAFKGTAAPGQKLPVIFFYNDYSKSRCVGDQYAVLGVGDEGKYFLKKNPDGTYTPVHWSGAQVKKRGESLPPCPAP